MVEQSPIIATIGEFGKWQLWVCAVIFVSKFPVGWHQLGHVFLAHESTSQPTCADPGNSTDACSDQCKKFEYDMSTFTNTIQMEWDLVCKNSYLPNLSQTFFMFGILVGNIVFGIWSDKKGRRIGVVVSMILQFVFGVINAVVPWFWSYCLFRFLLACATGGSMITTFVLVMELLGPKMREIVSILYHIPFNIGHSLLPLYAYFLRDWRWCQFAMSMFSVIFFSYIWLVPESPRWLMITGHIDESEKLLTKAAKCNNLPTEGVRARLDDAYKKTVLSQTPEGVKNASVLDLFRHRNLRIRTICMSYNWFVCGFCYYGIAQYIGNISGDIFTNFAFSGMLGVPGTILCIPMTKYLGRKISLITSNSLCGVSIILIAILPENAGWPVVLCAVLSLFGVAMSFPNVYLYGGEIFPTVVRSAGVGFVSMVARVGSMMAPHISGLKKESYIIPPLIFGSVALLGVVLTLFLPETKGLPLPETIEEAEAAGTKTEN